MKTSGPNFDGSIPKRGACVECGDPETINQVLTSFDGKKAAAVLEEAR